jgi:phage baseplate assembly protein W
MNPRKGTLGQGWSFPFGFDSANGQVALSSDEHNIRECISIILSTRPGERQMMPSFGCRIHELLFAPNTAEHRYSGRSPRLRGAHALGAAD